MLAVTLACCVLLSNLAQANLYAKMLYNDILRKSRYNKLVRPVEREGEPLVVKLGLRLSQLIDIDEKNQIMTTNVWLEQQWEDYMLKWTPEDYGGVDVLYVPAEEIWLPDIVLYNNADGNYQVTLMTKATVKHTGLVTWEPPAIYKSSCNIDVQYFPFDQQTCRMKFSSWTYDGSQVDLRHIKQVDEAGGEVLFDEGINMQDFYKSFIWDIMSVPAKRNLVYYPCCPESYPDVTFNITIRRKTLFYTVNLIIPCVAISFLTVLVFYLPSDSGEKIALCISILLSLTVFFLLLSDLIPPTSLVVPLIGKYLLFTMILVTMSVIITVIVLNIHHRSSTTHFMSPWVRKLFLHALPRLLMMEKPILITNRKTSRYKIPRGKQRTTLKDRNENLLQEKFMETSSDVPNYMERGAQSSAGGEIWVRKVSEPEYISQHHPSPWDKALDGATFIADHLKMEDRELQVKEDWKFVAKVLDRLFLWIFTTACVVGTFGIILQAPTLYDNEKPLDQS